MNTYYVDFKPLILLQKRKIETGAKKIGPVFWAISGMKNGFTAFC